MSVVVLFLDDLLEQHEAGEQGFGSGRAAGHVDVDGDDVVDAWQGGVAVGEGSADVGAGAHRDDPLGLGHLEVDAADGRGHFPGDGAGDDHEVGLAWGGAEDFGAEAGEVVAGVGGGDHFDRAAGEAEHGGPEGGASGPAEDFIDGGDEQLGAELVLDVGVGLEEGDGCAAGVDGALDHDASLRGLGEDSRVGWWVTPLQRRIDGRSQTLVDRSAVAVVRRAYVT